MLQPARCCPLPDLWCMCMGYEYTLPRQQTLTSLLGLTPVISSSPARPHFATPPAPSDAAEMWSVTLSP